MNHAVPSLATPIDPAPVPVPNRKDLYGLVHKALRAMMSDTLVRVGATDPHDDASVRDAVARVNDLLSSCEVHLHGEDAYIGAALAARRPGAYAALEREHQGQERTLLSLRAAVATVEDAGRDARGPALASLYTTLARFVGENLEHMHVEETAITKLLWESFTDEELAGIEREIVSHVPPEKMAKFARFMLVGLNHVQRVAWLDEMRASAPPRVFGAVVAMGRELLAAAEWAKLANALVLALASDHAS